MDVTVTETVRVHFHGVESHADALIKYLESRRFHTVDAHRIELVATTYRDPDDDEDD